MTAIQLLFLARTLPEDEDAMEAELAQYAASALERTPEVDDDSTLVSIGDRMISFDGGAARDSMRFVGVAFRELTEEFRNNGPFHCGNDGQVEEEEEDDGEDDVELKKKLWVQQQQQRQNRGVQHNGEGETAEPDESTCLLPPL